MRLDSFRRGLAPPWVLVGALIFGAGLFLVVVLIINVSRPPRVPVHRLP